MGNGVETTSREMGIEELKLEFDGIEGTAQSFGFQNGGSEGDVMLNLKATVSLIEIIWPSIQECLDSMIAQGYNPVILSKYYTVPLTFMVQLYTNTVDFNGWIHVFHVTEDAGDTDWVGQPAMLLTSEALKHFGVDLDSGFGEDEESDLDLMKELLGKAELWWSPSDDEDMLN